MCETSRRRRAKQAPGKKAQYHCPRFGGIIEECSAAGDSKIRHLPFSGRAAPWPRFPCARPSARRRAFVAGPRTGEATDGALPRALLGQSDEAAFALFWVAAASGMLFNGFANPAPGPGGLF